MIRRAQLIADRENGATVVPVQEVSVSESPSSDGARNTALLTIYCDDHLAASVGGMELVKRMVRATRMTATRNR